MKGKWMDLGGKVIIVTGGSMGIGAHIVETLVECNAKVVVADLCPCEMYEQDSRVLYIPCDVTRLNSVENMVRIVVDTCGRIDGLVNNAGVNRPRMLVDYYNADPYYENDEEDFNFMMDVNVKGVMFCAQAAARVMIKQKSGVIVNMSSEAGMEGSKGQSIYSATKGAVNSFTRSWAKELRAFNIRVVGVAPGINEPTPMGNPKHVRERAYTRGQSFDQAVNDYKDVIPLGRIGQLDEIADYVAYLLSDHASYITGTIHNITGGKSRG